MQSPIQSTITKVTTMADQTVRLQLDCQEMPPENMAEIFRLKGMLGFFFFAERPMKEIDLKDLPEIKVERGEKTKSQRLRGVLFALWEQTKTTSTFEEFYSIQMEKFIEFVKEKLDH